MRSSWWHRGGQDPLGALQPKPLVPVQTPNLVAPETPMPPPSQLIGRDIATAQLYPLRRVMSHGCRQPTFRLFKP